MIELNHECLGAAVMLTKEQHRKHKEVCGSVLEKRALSDFTLFEE